MCESGCLSVWVNYCVNGCSNGFVTVSGCDQVGHWCNESDKKGEWVNF